MKKFLISFFFIVLAGYSSLSFSDEYPSSTSVEFWNNFDVFFLNLSWLKTILLSPTSKMFLHIKIVAVAFSIFMILQYLLKFISYGTDVYEFVMFFGSIFAAKLFLDNYGTITSEGWIYATGIVKEIHIAAIGSESRGGINGFIMMLFDNISITSNTYNPILIAGRGFLIIILQILIAVFVFGSTLATIWALWGYAITCIWGIVVIPMVIMPITRFLFIAWLKVYLGYLIYYVIANLNLVIVYLLIISMFELPINIASLTHISIPVYEINVDEGFPFSLVTMLLIGIMSMLSVGSIAASLAGGGISIGSSLGSLALRKATSGGNQGNRSPAK